MINIGTFVLIGLLPDILNEYFTFINFVWFHSNFITFNINNVYIICNIVNM